MNGTQLTFFETSAWNRLADRSDREAIIAGANRRGLRIVAGVYAAGELLSTPSEARRRILCETVTRASDAVAPLLDHPEYLATYAARAWRAGEAELLAGESSGAKRLRFFLERPDRLDDDSRAEIARWIRDGTQADYQAVFDDLSDIGPRVGPPFCSREVLVMPEFNRLFAEKVPLVAELGLSAADLMDLCNACDVWKAYRALAAFTIDAAIDRMPESRPSPTGGRPQKRPGGPDIRQAVYLGVCETFVLRDDWFQESLAQIAVAAGLERRIVSTDEFFAELLRTS